MVNNHFIASLCYYLFLLTVKAIEANVEGNEAINNNYCNAKNQSN
jgi:hypothetical protein